MGVHPLEVREHDPPVESMAMLDAGVLDHRISNCFFVVPGDVETATRARLDERHQAIQSHANPER